MTLDATDITAAVTSIPWISDEGRAFAESVMTACLDHGLHDDPRAPAGAMLRVPFTMSGVGYEAWVDIAGGFTGQLHVRDPRILGHAEDDSSPDMLITGAKFTSNGGDWGAEERRDTTARLLIGAACWAVEKVAERAIRDSAAADPDSFCAFISDLATAFPPEDGGQDAVIASLMACAFGTSSEEEATA